MTEKAARWGAALFRIDGDVEASEAGNEADADG